MQAMNPFNYIGFAILGAALLWAVRLVYDARRQPRVDVMRRVLLLAGWILLVGGVFGVAVAATGWLSFVTLIALAVAGRGYWNYMEAERRGLLWMLAIASEKGIPLERAAHAFAEERSVQMGSRAMRFAELLEGGAPVPTALAMSRNPLSADALLATRIGHETGRMGPALRMCLEHENQAERLIRAAMVKVAYIIVVLLIGYVIVSFAMVKLVPVFVQMFEEFDVELPVATERLIRVSEFAVQSWPLGFLGYAVIFVTLLVALSYEARRSRYELPWTNRLWIRCDGALVLRSLALAVGQGRALGPTIEMLSKQYPRPSVARRLERAARRLERGVHWCDALRSVGLVRSVDVAVLKAAERAGNLAWAMEEMADSALRRFAYRIEAATSFAFPVLVLLLGGLVFFVVAGLFLPLVRLIEAMAWRI